MKNLFAKEIRVLAIDPVNKGFGYAVFEGPDKLIDWGVKSTKSIDKRRRLEQLFDLMERYSPDVIVVEDYADKGSRRGAQAKDLIRMILITASAMEIKTCALSPADVRNAFSQFGAATKYSIATILAKKFPELAPRLPPIRKPWMSEDYRMSIFDAVSLAWTFFSLVSY